MRRRRFRSPNLPIWLFACLLVLRALMPFVASASADLQGRALGEVCSVHGVVLTSPTQAPRDPLQVPSGDAAANHCALGGLAALGAAAAPLGVSVPVPADYRVAASTAPTVARPDAAATWVARQKHGPPQAA